MSRNGSHQTPPPREIDALFDAAAVIKSGKVREVRRAGDVFLKLDHRKHHSFLKEFRAAAALQQAGVPVVEPLYTAASDRGHYLATAAFDGIPLEEYLKKNTPDERFFNHLLNLIRTMHDAGFIHWDFHPGNLLCDPETGEFALVDVAGIRKIPKIFFPLIPEYIRFEVLAAFRGVMLRSGLLDLFQKAGISDPQSFYREIFIRDGKFIRRDWPKRRAQILGGYPKFTTVGFLDGTVLEDSESRESDFAQTEAVNDGRALFLAHFFLKLIRIPHRRAVRYSPADDVAFLMTANASPAPRTAAEEMVERLRFYGIRTAAEDWRMGSGEVPELHALAKVAAQKFITGGQKA